MVFLQHPRGNDPARGAGSHHLCNTMVFLWCSLYKSKFQSWFPEKATTIFKTLTKHLYWNLEVSSHSAHRHKEQVPPQGPALTPSLRLERLLPYLSSPDQGKVPSREVTDCPSWTDLSVTTSQFLRGVNQLHKVRWQSILSLGFTIFCALEPDCLPDLVFLPPSSSCRAPGSSPSLPAVLPLLVPEPSQLLLLPSGTAFPYLTASLPLCLCSNLCPFLLIYYCTIFLFPSAATYFLTL